MIRLALINIKYGEGADYVFQRRDCNAPTSPNLLAFFGGKAVKAEDPRDAALRELSEETSLDVTPEDLTPVVKSMRIELKQIIPKTFELHLFRLVIPQIEIEVYEGAGAEFYTPCEIARRNDLAPTLDRLKKYIA